MVETAVQLADPPKEWVVLELSPRAEGENPEVIEVSIHHLLRGSVVYIPGSVVHMDDETIIHYLIDGYLFIRRDFPDERFYRLEGSKYIQSVVTKPSALKRFRQLACVSEKEIERLRAMVRQQEDQGIEVGDTVVVISGPYKRIKADVIEEIPELDSVQVHIHLRSKESLVTLPRSCLRLESKAPRPPWVEKGEKLCAWFKAAMPALLWSGNTRRLSDLLSQWETLYFYTIRVQHLAQIYKKAPDVSVLEQKYLEYLTVTQHLNRLLWLESVIEIPEIPPTQALREVEKRWGRLHTWNAQAGSLAHSLKANRPLPSLSIEIVGSVEKWLVLNSFVSRVRPLAKSMKMISQNLVFDGNNLVCRCAMAPGLADLRDHQGRPTGGIVGTINALAALKKRYPKATLYFVWDGSSRRRKELFPGYKEGRGEPKATFEGSWLREALPYFGVTQVVNPVEEADDVVASLVEGMLAGQQNIIVSTDRDLLQLASSTTSLLVPSVGSGKEQIYTPVEVRSEYGVESPDLMPHVRALSGDTSDNIPGVPGFGLKTAKKILGPYKTIDRLLQSNLAGLSQAQYAALKANVSRVRQNVDLLTLVRGLTFETIPATIDSGVALQRLQDVDAKAERSVRVFFPDTT